MKKNRAFIKRGVLQFWWSVIPLVICSIVFEVANGATNSVQALQVFFALLSSPAQLKPRIGKDGIKRKERPTGKGVSWLVKTRYISPNSMESTNKVIDNERFNMSTPDTHRSSPRPIPFDTVTGAIKGSSFWDFVSSDKPTCFVLVAPH